MPKKSKEQTPEPEKAESSGALEFPSGLPGFEEHKQFVLESRAELRPFLWLRSLEDPDVALPVISCLLLKSPVFSHLGNKHLDLLDNPSQDEILPYYILRIEPEDGSITVNTKAPVVISTKTLQGYQLILDREDLRVDVPLVDLVPSTGDV
ncbi:MAG: flagellar assembly protein FliW [Fidelibacterota bacterium]|nr:MAG: flagellar assembly protein FliW [Candidatus Neomarinimicrobiota bacterium]